MAHPADRRAFSEGQPHLTELHGLPFCAEDWTSIRSTGKSMQVEITSTELLEAMDGVVLVLNPDLVVSQIGWRNWNSFWNKNGGGPPLDVVGRDIATFFSDGEVRVTYHKIFSEVATRKRGHFHLDYRCDSPSLKRSMRLSLTPIDRGSELQGLLYQSTLLSAEQRLPIPLFENLRGVDAAIVTICSVCAKVRWPSDENRSHEEWIEPPEFYRRGGDERVLLSHGFCEACFQKLKDDEG